MKPSNDPTMGKTKREGGIPIAVTKQLWQRSGRCPEGTIPIRRMQTKTGHEAKKPFLFHHHDKKLMENNDLDLLQTNHSVFV